MILNVQSEFRSIAFTLHMFDGVNPTNRAGNQLHAVIRHTSGDGHHWRGSFHCERRGTCRRGGGAPDPASIGSHGDSSFVEPTSVRAATAWSATCVRRSRHSSGHGKADGRTTRVARPAEVVRGRHRAQHHACDARHQALAGGTRIRFVPGPPRTPFLEIQNAKDRRRTAAPPAPRASGSAEQVPA